MKPCAFFNSWAAAFHDRKASSHRRHFHVVQTSDRHQFRSSLVYQSSRSVLVMMAVLVVSFAPEAQCQPPVIHAFPETGVDSRVYAVSGNGSAAFGSFKLSETSGVQPFRWSLDSGIAYLDTVADYPSAQPWKANFDGSVAVGRVYVGNYESYRAARWSVGGVQELGLLSPTDGNSAALGVSANGQVVVGEIESGGLGRAFRWTTADGMQDLGSFNSSDRVTARSVSDDGSLIAGWSGGKAFGWTPDQGMFGLADPDGAFASYATAVTADGNYITGYFALSQGGPHGLSLWSEQGGVESPEILVSTPAGSTSLPYAISADGSTIVGAYVYGRAVIWTRSTGLVTLSDHLASLGTDLDGWSDLFHAYDVSADGRTIVGAGNYLGTTRGFMVTAVPEPSTYALLLMTCAATLWHLRRRR